MEIRYDKKAQVLRVILNDHPWGETLKVTDDLYVDLDKHGRPARIELLGVSGNNGYIDDPGTANLIVAEGIDYITLPEMAQMHDVDEDTIKQDLINNKIEGAFEDGMGEESIWVVPRHIAETWKPANDNE